MATLTIAQDPEADRVLSQDPFALLVGMLLDQQFPMERAFAGPAVLVIIQYTEGLAGRNVFLLSERDASVVADLMMGGEGAASEEISDLHASADYRANLVKVMAKRAVAAAKG